MGLLNVKDKVTATKHRCSRYNKYIPPPETPDIPVSVLLELYRLVPAVTPPIPCLLFFFFVFQSV